MTGDDLIICKNCRKAYNESDSHERFEEFCSSECETDSDISRAEARAEDIK